MPYGWTVTYIIRNRRSTKVAKIMVVHCHLTFFTVRSSLLPYAFVWEKPLKILFSKTEDAYGWTFTYIIGNRRSTKVAKIMVVHCHLTFFTVRSILLPYAFVWEKCSEFQTTSPLEPLGQFCSNFIWSLLRLGEWKIAKRSRLVDQDGRHVHIW